MFMERLNCDEQVDPYAHEGEKQEPTMKFEVDQVFYTK